MEKLNLIKTTEELSNLINYLQDKNFIAYDIETTGTEKGSTIIGFSVCADIDEAFYVICARWDVDQKKLITNEAIEFQIIVDLLELLKTKDIICHNGVFDCMHTADNFGVSLIDSLHTDTMILGHLLNENRHNGLKELGISIFGEDAAAEQLAMKESVSKNGGVLTKEKYELYKADANLIGKYGAKDTILTLKLFYTFIPQLESEGLFDFFYDECMPLFKGPTYDLNTIGLRVDLDKLQSLRGTLEVECAESKAFIERETYNYVKDKYPGTGKSNKFNIGSSKQLAWLIFDVLGCEFKTLTDGGRELCKVLETPIPYSPLAKRNFIQQLRDLKVKKFEYSTYDYKKKKHSKKREVSDYWHYLKCDKDTLGKYKHKYKFLEKLLEYAKNQKILTTYVMGIQSRVNYGIIRPSFLQHGTTSGRYSCKNPNFQNLPRTEKRVKSCIVSRQGRVFVGADYSQLEPRVFASVSGDERLLKSFKDGDDFYSVIGVEIFGKQGCSLKKNDPNSFAVKHPDLRDKAKVVALSSAYGTTAFKMAPALGKSTSEAQEIIDDYFESFPSVKQMMLDAHEYAKKHGSVYNLFGRPRRMPDAKNIGKLYGTTKHVDLPYEARNVLNLAVNHTIQSTGASIVNRASIEVYRFLKTNGIEAHIVLNVHDELVLECDEKDADLVKLILKECMENSVVLKGVDLIAEPKIAYNLADLK